MRSLPNAYDLTCPATGTEITLVPGWHQGVPGLAIFVGTGDATVGPFILEGEGVLAALLHRWGGDEEDAPDGACARCGTPAHHDDLCPDGYGVACCCGSAEAHAEVCPDCTDAPA